MANIIPLAALNIEFLHHVLHLSNDYNYDLYLAFNLYTVLILKHYGFKMNSCNTQVIWFERHITYPY